MNSTIDVFIDLDGQKFKKKKLCPESYLNKIRSQLKLSNDIIFLSKDGYQIDNEDEEQSPLNDCLIQNNKINKLNLKTNKNNYITINVYLNNNKIHSCSYSNTILLKDLLKDYENLLPKDAILMSEGYPVDLEDYREKMAVEILENNNLYYESEENKKLNKDKNLINKKLKKISIFQENQLKIFLKIVKTKKKVKKYLLKLVRTQKLKN